MSEKREEGQYDDAQGRLSIAEVPEQISRIFFGDNSYSAPSNSYGAPSYNTYPPSGGTPIYPPFYPGYLEDLELLVKLGQAALIVFIILAIVAIIFMLLLACLYCGGSSSSKSDESSKPRAQPYHKRHDQSDNKDSHDRIEVMTNHAFENEDLSPRISSLKSTSEQRQSSEEELHHPHPTTATSLSRHRGLQNLNRSVSSSDTTVESINNHDNTLLPRRQPSTKKPSFIFSEADKIREDYSHSSSDINQERRESHKKLSTMTTQSMSTSDMRSSSTLDTVIKRPLPATPMAVSSSKEDQQPQKAPKRWTNRQLSLHSDSTDMSQPRSVPYYEVPAPQTTSSVASRRDNGFTITSTTEINEETSTNFRVMEENELARLGARSRQPFAIIESHEQESTHSRLI